MATIFAMQKVKIICPASLGNSFSNVNFIILHVFSPLQCISGCESGNAVPRCEIIWRENLITKVKHVCYW